MSSDNIIKQIKDWRQHLHMYSESAFAETQTADFIARVLTGLGLEVHRNIGGTGVVGNLKVDEGIAVIGLRADMDAINMQEIGESAYAFRYSGKMHACGHDGHVATLLGAAKLLAERKNFNGTLRFIFQPAEEPGKGAQAMIDDGFFGKHPIDEIYGLHNAPFLPETSINTRSGGIMAS